MVERARAGRIGGVWSPSGTARDRLDAMARTLGPGASLIGVEHGPGDAPRILAVDCRAEDPGARAASPATAPAARGVRDVTIADFDACFLHGEPVRDLHAVRDRLGELDGAFAAAVYRAGRDALELSSDPIGHRSLYYAVGADGTVAFASTLPAVLAAGVVPVELDAAIVPFYLTFAYVPGERTLARGVRVLVPGTRLVVDRHGARLETTWRLPESPSGGDGDDGDEERQRLRLRAALEDAVARALADARDGATAATIGATLSGGIDSSLVLALARKRHEGPLHAYSVSFGEGYANELPYSSLVARHCGVAQHVVVVRPEDVRSAFDETVAALSTPNGDPLTVPNTLLFRRAAEDTGVVLNGEGGDPCFGGPKNAPMLLGELFDDAVPDPSEPDDGFARERRFLRSHQKCYDDLPELLAPELAETRRALEMERRVRAWLGDETRAHFLDRLMAVNVTWKGAHHILPKVDHLSFSAGVRPRSPLFDRRVVELSFRLPARLKRHGAVEKYLLKRAVADLLPQAILDRPKSGMLVPVEAWFRGPLAGFARERLLDGLPRQGLFRRPFLEALVSGKLPGLRPRHGVKIWLLLTLESWLRNVLGRSPP